jgi:hypothetical protein
MNHEENPCSDCGGEFKSIKLIDQMESQHEEMVYTVPQAQRSLWGSKFPVAGTVEAIMCQSCGLIKLYGRSKLR